MRRNASFLFLISLFLLIASEKFEKDGDVIVLKESNFDVHTTEGEWLLEFFAPWCGHCQRLAPIYAKVATNLKDKFNVAKVDCTVEKSLCERFSVKGYPTLFFLKDGKLYDFQEDRTEEGFQKFVEGSYKHSPVKDVPKTPKEMKIIEKEKENQARGPKVEEARENNDEIPQFPTTTKSESSGAFTYLFVVVVAVGAFVLWVKFQPKKNKIHYGKD